jgi:hypothetical protein
VAILQNYVTPFPLAMAGATHLICLILLAMLLRNTPPQAPAWRVVGPGGTHWFCFVGGWTFSALMTWVWPFVGLARRDAEEQRAYLLALIFAFGLGAVLSGFYVLRLRRMALRWRGRKLRWRVKGRDIAQDMADFESWRRSWSGFIQLRFRDGTTLNLDLYARSAEELSVVINEQSGGRFDVI